MSNADGRRFASRRGRLLWSVSAAASLLLSACAPQRADTGPFPRYAEFEGDEVTRVAFAGDVRVPEDSLRAVIQTRASRCRFLFLPICIPFTSFGEDNYFLDLNELAEDVSRIQLYHRDHGYYGADVAPDIESVGDGEVEVEFFVAPGRQVVLQELLVEGVDTILSEEDLLADLPLTVGEPFGRVAFLASADTIRRQLFARGHAYADVLRNYSIDTIAGAAEVEYVAIPGPIVYVDTIVFQGNDRLAERVLRRQMTFREGELLRAEQLDNSQRNLYSLNMVNFAAIRLAPDTMQAEQEVSQATILVEVLEAAQYAVETSVGFGTVDCFRTNARWMNRNFLGGGRRLEVLGSLARIGAGRPLDMGLDNSVCDSLGEQGLLGIAAVGAQDLLDYRLSFDVQQPSIFGTQNQLAVNLHSERISEADAYIRESTGGRVTTVRDIESIDAVLSTTAEVSLGRTLASPAILCVGFDTCGQRDLDLLRRSRWSNSLSIGAVHDGQQTDGITSRGYVVRGGLDWSSPVLGSQDNYLRLLTEASYYLPLQRGWVLASNLRVGRFLQGVLGPASGYIPPERRFYAGGPNSVRGYTRNALGPTSYVVLPEGGDTIASATGGTQMIVSTAELRLPSPWQSDIMRLAAFVDAGMVSAPGADLLSPTGMRVTPGVGLRLVTPVGPFRFDVAYNPYRRESGRLYDVDPRVGLTLSRPFYQPPAPSFWGRFRIQFALGQAF
ncbi:MAG: BamA/TamA family outer membrane protein [Gemmatimonadota bacterium]